MPAGLVQGADAADVAAYVAGISGGPTAGTPAPAPDAGRGEGPGGAHRPAARRPHGAARRARDRRLDRLDRGLGRAAGGRHNPRRADGPAGAGGRGRRVDPRRIRPCPGGGERRGSGPDGDARAGSRRGAPGSSSWAIRARPAARPCWRRPPARSRPSASTSASWRRPATPTTWPNVRFHGEHMVNITRGEPLEDVDGNGDPSNPGDGIGLIDGPGAYLVRVPQLVGSAADADGRRRPGGRARSSPPAGRSADTPSRWRRRCRPSARSSAPPRT